MTHTIDLLAFIAFCKAKPADLEYDYGDITWCPLAQFLRAENPDQPISVGSTHYDIGDLHDIPLPKALNQAVGGCRTFDALARRLEALHVRELGAKE